MKRSTDFEEANEEYEVVTGVSEKFPCEAINSEACADNIPEPYYKESLESFREHPEIIDGQWIERIIQDTRPLTQWQKQKGEDLQTKGEAFDQCPVPHPHGNLPTANRNIKNYNGNQSSFALETNLSKISKGKRGKYKCLQIDGEKKFHPEVTTAGSIIHGVAPEEAIKNYCQQYAYSRARLLRTDRRELANELLELMSTDSDTSEIHIARSSTSASPPPNSRTSLLTTRFGNQRNASPLWQVVEGAQPNASAYNLDRKDTKHLFDCHLTLSDQTDIATATQASVPCRDVKRKETADTAWKNKQVADINEPLKISPCAFLPNEGLSNSRRKSTRRHKSVPRFIPTSIINI